MLKKICFLIALMCCINVAFSQVVSIGNGTETDDQLPIEPYYNYTYSQSIYLASEIGESGNIYRIKYKGAANLSISNSNEWVVYIGHTSQDVFTPNNWIATTNMTQVFFGNISVVNNDVEIILDTPFNYNGTDNLVIAVDENQASGDNSSDNFLSTNVTGFRSIVYRNDNNNPDPATISENTISQSAVPNIDLDFNATACNAPSALTADNITTTSANLTWTIGNSETSWEIEYGVDGFTQGSGTTITVNSSSYNVSSLNPSTSYEYYVRAKCNAIELSAWVGPFDFTTACATVTAFPFTENFEGITSGQPNCWGIAGTTTTNSYHWNSYVTGYQGRGIRFNSYNNSSGRTSELTTPTFDLSGLTTAELKFYFRNPTGGDFEVLISTNGGTSYTSLEAGLTGQTDWVEKTYSLTSYIGSDVMIQFKGTSNFGSGNAYIFLDNIIVREIPSCVAPSSLTATSITDTSATLGWTAENSETSWEVEYGVDGFTQGTGTTVNATTNPITVNTLTGNTAYEFYVRANCGGGDYSTWSGPFDFTTSCSAYTIPYFEGFETGYTNSQALSGCLTQESIAGTNDWTANNTSTSYNRAPRTGDWNAYLRYGNEDWFFIPINLTASQSYTVTIYARQDGTTASNVNLAISYGTSADAASMTNEILPATGLVNGDYQKLSGNFTPTSTSLYYVGIKGYLNSSPWYISIDDITIDVSPNCLEPTNLTASNITDTSATLGWTAENSETSWEVEYGADGFTQGAGTTINASTNPITINTLTGNTAYEFYVRANCGGDYSAWTGPFDFTTICSSFTASYSQNFDGVSTPNIDDCWTASVVGASSSFASIESTTFNDLSAPNSIRISNSSDNDGDYYLVSPRFSDLDNTKRVRFQMYKDISNDADGDIVEVGIISDISNFNTFTNIHTFALSDFDEDAWKLMVVDFSSYAGGAGHIAIKYQPGTGDYNSWYVDDFVYEVAPTAVPVCATNLNATANTAGCGNSGYTIAWDAVANSDGYKISIGTTSGGNDLVNNQDIGGNTSYSFGTTISTTYYWTVTPYNTVGDATGCGEVSFTTNANGCYCNPTSTSTSTYIDSFSTTGAEENILNENSGHATDGFDDLYATTSVKVTSQNSFDFNITIQGGTLGCAIWVDWNGDFAFDPATELVYETTSYSSGPFNGTITLPNGVQNGDYRMRVLVDYNDSTPGDESCAFNSGNRGEAEDYKLIVDNPLSIQDETLSSVKYYPNPVSSFLVINGKKPFTRVTISNLMGQEVINVNQSSTEYNIDMSNLKNGMYIVRIYSDQTFKTLKVVKQ